jgi:DNA-binding CsgD family transcriptional regulator
MVAVRKLLVANLAGAMPNAEFVRVLPALCAQLAPHVRAEAVSTRPLALVDGEPVDLGPVDRLTDREIEILGLAAAGLTNARIGARLGLTENTVKTHFKRAFARLGVQDRAHAVAIAIRRGIIS